MRASIAPVVRPINRRAFVAGLGAVLAAPLAAEAQQARKIWRIGLLDYSSNPASSSRWNALRDRLRELGYLEGQNALFESRWGDGQSGRLPGLAAELVKAKVDIIVTAGSETTAVLKQATSSIPVVMATGGDVVGLGLVASLARPGGNITGVISLTSELGGKRLELLHQLIPGASRIGIVRDLDNRGTRLYVDHAKQTAKSMGIVLQIVGVHGHKDLDGAFLAMKRARADAVLFLDQRGQLLRAAVGFASCSMPSYDRPLGPAQLAGLVDGDQDASRSGRIARASIFS